MTAAKAIALFLVSGLLLPPAGGEEAPGAAPMYAVEIIVFEYLDQDRNSPEATAPVEPVAAASAGSEVPLAARPGFLLLEPHPQPDFLPLAADDYRLGAIYERLTRLDAYRPLLHTGWIQPARPRELSEPIVIGLHTPKVPGLGGQLLLSKERFVHLQVELQYQPPGTEDWQLAGSSGIHPAVIHESRRLRAAPLEYFDHPRFGVLASVRELPASEPEEPAT